MSRHWLFNPFAAAKRRAQSLEHQVDQNLELPAIGLPPTASWTQYLTQTILVGVVIGIGWSILARVDVVVNASGKLEPQSQSQAIQSRAGGVVTAVRVREGEAVKRGQLLMQLDKTPLHNQLQSLSIQRRQLIQEIAILRMAQQGQSIPVSARRQAGVSPELLNQVQTRLLLVAQLTGDPTGLDAVQRQRFDLYQQQLRDRQAISRLQITNISSQIGQADAQAAQTQYQLQTEQELLANIEPLVDAGAIARVTLLQRKVGVSDLQSQLIQNDLQKRQLEIGQLQTRVETGKALNDSQQNLQQQLSALDTQFDTTIKESQRQLLEINARLKQVQLDLKNQDLRAPADGIVFNLGPKLPGMVTQPGQTLLQVVPNESLTARVQVANADIANIREGMPVDVRIDAYPFTEFGAIKGVVAKVSREAIKTTDQPAGAAVFPVEVRLDRQFLERQSQRLALTPGMSIATLIKVRQRAPISYVTEEITKAFDSSKSIR